MQIDVWARRRPPICQKNVSFCASFFDSISVSMTVKHVSRTQRSMPQKTHYVRLAQKHHEIDSEVHITPYFCHELQGKFVQSGVAKRILARCSQRLVLTYSAVSFSYLSTGWHQHEICTSCNSPLICKVSPVGMLCRSIFAIVARGGCGMVLTSGYSVEHARSENPAYGTPHHCFSTALQTMVWSTSDHLQTHVSLVRVAWRGGPNIR